MSQSSEDLERRIEFLKAQVLAARQAYYQDNASHISDARYDALERELQSAEAQRGFSDGDSPTLTVGSAAQLNLFEPVQHIEPMLSLDNVFSKEQLRAWYERIQRICAEPLAFVCELKIDGVGISLRYINGKLVSIATRGDGATGEDITQNMIHVQCIPPTIPFGGVFEIRGEVFIKRNDFDAVNQSLSSAGSKEFANPRNFVSGCIRTKVPNASWLELLSFYAHGFTGVYSPSGLGSAEFDSGGDSGCAERAHSGPFARVGSMLNASYELTGKSMFSIYFKLSESGVPVNSYNRLCQSLLEIESYIDTIESKRHEVPYITDGVVVKLDNIAQQAVLGNTTKAPRWAVAYKFPPPCTITRLLDIEVGIGRTGRVTPYAILEPVQLGGASVARATLHNQKVISEKGLLIGDYVKLRKAGEIIPEVLCALPEMREGCEKPFVMPSACPSCGAKLMPSKLGDVDLRCPNTQNCPVQLASRLEYIGSRGVFDIAYLAEENAHALSYLRKFDKSAEVQLFKITVEDLVSLEFIHNGILKSPFRKKGDNLPGFEEPVKSATEMISSINMAKQSPLWKFLLALNIRHIGPASAKILAEHFGSIDAIMQANIDDFLGVRSLGEAIAVAVHDWFREPWRMELIETWRADGALFGA